MKGTECSNAYFAARSNHVSTMITIRWLVRLCIKLRPQYIVYRCPKGAFRLALAGIIWPYLTFDKRRRWNDFKSVKWNAAL